MDPFYYLQWIVPVGAVILGFLFPAELIDAIRLTDEEKAHNARGKACVTFGFLVICFLLLR